MLDGIVNNLVHFVDGNFSSAASSRLDFSVVYHSEHEISCQERAERVHMRNILFHLNDLMACVLQQPPATVPLHEKTSIVRVGGVLSMSSWREVK